MTLKETASIITMFQAVYADSFKNQSPETLQRVVRVWQNLFADDPLELVLAACKAFMSHDTGRFAPTPGIIRQEMAKLNPQAGTSLTELEAWSLVYRAVCRSAYNAREEFEKLPPIVQKAVGTHQNLRQWAMMDESEVQSVVASNFQRSFRAAQTREKETALLPADVQALRSRLASAAVSALESPEERKAINAP